MTGPEPPAAFLRKWRKDHASLVDAAKASNLLVGRKRFGAVPNNDPMYSHIAAQDDQATAHWGEPPPQYAED